MVDYAKICQKCGATCCKVGGTDFNEEEKKAVLNAGHEDYFVKIEEEHYELRTENGVCPYLINENSCEIYEHRPKLCRRWPVYTYIRNNIRETSLIMCPISSYLQEEDINSMKELADNISLTFIADSIEKSKIQNLNTYASIKCNAFNKIQLGYKCKLDKT
ncbi:YkgJ family cysteine cluster protein [bacterium]|nr:YkgJ family cysteine cluster protein [bacterium]